MRVDAIKLPAKSVAQGIALTNLGAINVLCGPNNSGKTTVLQYIANGDGCVGGCIPSEQSITEAWGYCVNASGMQAFEPTSSVYKSLRRVFDETFGVVPVWYADELQGIIAKFDERYRSDPMLRGRRQNLEYLTRSLATIFGVAYKAVLLPAPRSLDARSPIITEMNPASRGDGILNRLFTWQTQPPGSTERLQYERIADEFKQVSGGFAPWIRAVPSNQVELMFLPPSGRAIPADQCGLGLRDTLVLLFWACQAEDILLLVEEPEAHLHATMQRRLLGFLRQRSGKQVLISTHSNVFLDPALVDRVFQLAFTDHVEIKDATSKAEALASLGYSVADNLVADLVILTEGPHDNTVIEEFLTKMGLWTKYQIRLWPLGGDVMRHVDLGVLTGAYTVLALLDKDPQSDETRRIFKGQCKEHNVSVHTLERYAMENYFPEYAIAEATGIDLPEGLTLDHSQSLKKQLGQSIKRKSRALARATRLEDIMGTDFGRFLKRVQSELEKSP